MTNAAVCSVRGRLFFATGTAFIVLGGLVAAVTGPLALERGSWLAAYLVLVCGVAQCVIGWAEDLLRNEAIGRQRPWLTFWLWNGGNVAVIVGTLLRQPFIVDAGGALLMVALVLSLIAVSGSAHRLRAGYRVILVLLLLSIPIGLTLAHLRTR